MTDAASRVYWARLTAVTVNVQPLPTFLVGDRVLLVDLAVPPVAASVIAVAG
jgi:hypothetical protein